MESLKGKSRKVFLDLKEQIRSLPDGYLLPSIIELREKYSAGQKTVEKGIDVLKEMKLLRAIPRKGLFVHKHEATLLTSDKHRGIYPSININIPKEPTFGIYKGCHPVWSKIVERFNSGRTGVKLKLEFIENNKYEFETSKDIQNFDLIYFPNNPFLKWSGTSSLSFVNLNDVINHLELDEMYPVCFNRDLYGRVWGIACSLSPHLFIYNNELFEQFGISKFSLEWNWDDLMDKCIFLKKESGKYGVVFGGYMIYLFNRGINFVESETGKIKINREAFSKAIIYMKKMIKEEQVAPFFTDIYPKTQPAELFLNKQTCMLEVPSCQISSLYELSPFKFDAVPMSLENSTPPPIYTDQLSINANTLHFDISWEFIQFILSEEGQRLLFSEVTNVPVRKNMKPEKVSCEMFEVQQALVNKGTTRLEDYFISSSTRVIIEKIIDRWIKYGGSIKNLIDEIELKANHYKSDINVRGKYQLEHHCL